MKFSKLNGFVTAALFALPGSIFAADITRNNTANDLVSDTAWTTVAPSESDRAVWNSGSVGGATTLGGDASWQGILISGATPTSGPLFTNAVNLNSHTLSLGAGGINLNSGDNTNRGISFESNTKLDLAANQTWSLGNGVSTAANIVVSSVISGTGSLEVTRNAAASNLLQLSGANTFTGGFTLNAGAVLNIGSIGVTAAGGVLTSSATGTGNVTLADGVSIGNTAGANKWYSSTLSLNGTANLISNNRLTVNFKILELTSGAKNLNVNGKSMPVAGGNTLTSETTGNSQWELVDSTHFGAPVVQNGTLNLETTAFTGTNYGTMRISNAMNFTNADLIIGNNVLLMAANTGTLGTSAATSPNLTINSAGILNLVASAATGRTVNVKSLTGSGSVFGSMNATNVNTTTLALNGIAGSTDFSGTIANGPGSGTLSLTKTGAATQIFSGTNSYTGKTTVSAGTLRFAKQVSLYNNTPASWTDTNIQVDSNAVLALNVGGTGEFTSSNIASLTALGTASGGFRSGSKLGLDTTNAGGSFTYGSVLANPNAGVNALGLRKLGSGTLILDQVNTFTGGTVVEGGGITIFGNAGLGTAALVLNAGTVLNADFSGLVAHENFTHNTTGTGTINVTPASGAANAIAFTSGTLTTFAGTINVKPSPASNTRVNFSGLIGSGATVNVENGAGGRFGLTGTYSGITVNAVGQGGDAGSAIRLDGGGVFDSACAVNLLGTTSVGGFTGNGTIDCAIADGGNGYSLIKSSNSTLILTATNTYTGDTSVNGGTLRISKPYLANSSAIIIGAAAILDLNFDESGGAVTDTVSTLTLDGVQQAAGVYGASGSGATTINDTNFAGVGTLTVLNGPAASDDFASWALATGVSGGPGGDSNNNGITNLVEYALVDGGARGVFSGSTITFTKRGEPYGTDLSYSIETSETLTAGSWTAAVTGGTATEIAYTFTPGSPVKKFARLKVVQIP